MMDEGTCLGGSAHPPAGQSGLLQEGRRHPSAKVFPLENASRHLSMYDPATDKFTLISTCFPTIT